MIIPQNVIETLAYGARYVLVALALLTLADIILCALGTSLRAWTYRRRLKQAEQNERPMPPPPPEKRSHSVGRGLAAMSAFCAISLVLLALGQPDGIDIMGLMLAAALPAMVVFSTLFLRKTAPQADMALVLSVGFLCMLGVVVQYRLRPDTALRQFAFYGAGTVVLLVASMVTAKIRTFFKLRWLLIVGGLGLLALAVVFGDWTYGARNWLAIGQWFSFQPSEFVKPALVLVLAVYLGRYKRLLSLWPTALFLAGCVGLLILQRDLGATVQYIIAAVALFYAATSNLFLVACGAVAAAGGAVVSYKLFAHVRVRVSAWQNPWAAIEDGGYQIVQGLMAIGSGGFFGLGLNNGTPKSIPAYHTDYVFAVICEEFGLVVGIAVLAVYAVIIVRGAAIALKAKNREFALIALGGTIIIAFQAFLIVGGVIKLIPLTGVTLPFISYGGSSILACMAMVGMMLGAGQRAPEADAPPPDPLDGWDDDAPTKALIKGVMAGFEEDDA